MSRVHVSVVRIGGELWAIGTASTDGAKRGKAKITAEVLAYEETRRWLSSTFLSGLTRSCAAGAGRVRIRYAGAQRHGPGGGVDIALTLVARP